jgi:hypothetical protein
MIWRGCALIAGAPVGLLVGWVGLGLPPSPLKRGLCALADWGAPTGLALWPDGTRLVLGQRRIAGGARQERLVEVELACQL